MSYVRRNLGTRLWSGEKKRLLSDMEKFLKGKLISSSLLSFTLSRSYRTNCSLLPQRRMRIFSVELTKCSMGCSIVAITTTRLDFKCEASWQHSPHSHLHLLASSARNHEKNLLLSTKKAQTLRPSSLLIFITISIARRQQQRPTISSLLWRGTMAEWERKMNFTTFIKFHRGFGIVTF